LSVWLIKPRKTSHKAHAAFGIPLVEERDPAMQSLIARLLLPTMMTACVALCAGTAQAQFAGLQLNGNAAITEQGDLSLVTGFNQASSAYSMAPLALSPTFTFSTTFSVALDKINRKVPQADGFAFVVQDDPAGATALGYDGSCLAVCDIQNYAAIVFQSYVNDDSGLWLNGTKETKRFGLGFRTETVDVTVTYSQATTTLAYNAVNETTGGTASGSYTVDLTTLGPSVYIGFTGASGSGESNAVVKSWTFQYTP
jgi:hypothetical protein